MNHFVRRPAGWSLTVPSTGIQFALDQERSLGSNRDSLTTERAESAEGRYPPLLLYANAPLQPSYMSGYTSESLTDYV